MELIEVKRMHQAFLNFSGDMRNLWEEYSFLNQQLLTTELKEFEIKSLYNTETHPKKKSNAGGMREKFIKSSNGSNHFVSAISTFEDYIALLCKNVYTMYPQQIEAKDFDGAKIFHIILDSEDKKDMLEKIVEQKVRGIFYGKPTDIFLKDRCHFGLNNVFQNKYMVEIKIYEEMTARRNLIVHNQGRVDRKYLKEIPNSTFKNGEKIFIEESYLRCAIALLIGIAAICSECIVNKYSHENIAGSIKRSVESFERASNRDWFSTLLRGEA